MKCRCRIISRLISIEVLWESFHPNTLIKGWTLDYHHHLPKSLSSLSALFCHLVSYLIRVYCNGITFRLISRHTVYFVADEEEPSAVMEVKLDEVKLWLVVVTWLLLQKLSAPKVMLLQLLSSSNTSSAKREIFWRGTLKGTLNENLVKNLPTWWKRLGRKTGRPLKTSYPRREADESQRVMLLVKNLLTQ